MKFETLKKDNRKRWVIGVCGILAIIGTIAFVGTRAKYKTTQRIDLVDGTINWKPYDLNMVAIKLQNDSGEYTDTNTVPTSGYVLSDTSYCEVNGTKDSSITINYHDGVVAFDNMSKKGTKCFLYFDEKIILAKDVILEGKTIDESRSSGSFTGALTENTTGKIYKAKDDDGDTYFFAGAVDNNWVQFGGFYWRIIRINGDGTIRMIYSGVANGDVSDANKAGITTQINGAKYYYATSDGKYGDNAYVGYMYGQVGASSYADAHKNTTSSYAKQQADIWYNTNLNKDGIKEHIDTNAGFCGDRKIGTTTMSGYNNYGYGTNKTVYITWSRIVIKVGSAGSWNSTQTPTFKCSQSNDLYTTSSASKGNKALQYPVGLITADEVVYAGGFGRGINNSYYLCTNQGYWTMSPCEYDGDWAINFTVNSGGDLNNSILRGQIGVRPVINLKADTKLTGNGTEASPFKVS